MEHETVGGDEGYEGRLRCGGGERGGGISCRGRRVSCSVVDGHDELTRTKRGRNDSKDPMSGWKSFRRWGEDCGMEEVVNKFEGLKLMVARTTSVLSNQLTSSLQVLYFTLFTFTSQEH